MNSKREEDHLFKVLLIGDSKSGKFDLIREYLSHTSEGVTNQISSKDFTTHIIQIDKKSIKLQIWDTAGDPKFRSLIIPQFKGTKGIILVYSTGYKQSFANIDKWIAEIKEHAKENVAKVLVGNSWNLEDGEEVEVTSKEGKEYAEKLGIPFFEVSKKHFSPVKETFISVTKQMLVVVQEEIRQREEEEELKRIQLEGAKKGKSASTNFLQTPKSSENKQDPSNETNTSTKQAQNVGPSGKSYDYLLKILLVGASGVGKTSIVNQLVKKEFSEGLPPSTGAKVSKRTYKINNKTFKIELWDTPGPTTQWTDKEKYYKDTDGMVFVYDISDKSSFTEIEDYIIDAQKFIPGVLLKTLVGNKNDLSANREVNFEEAKSYAETKNAQIVETSTKENFEGKSILTKIILDLVAKADKSGKMNVGKKEDKKDDKFGCFLF